MIVPNLSCYLIQWKIKEILLRGTKKRCGIIWLDQHLLGALQFIALFVRTINQLETPPLFFFNLVSLQFHFLNNSSACLCLFRLMSLIMFLIRCPNQLSTSKWIWKSLFRNDPSSLCPPPLITPPLAPGAEQTTALSFTGNGGRPLRMTILRPTRTKWTFASP